MADSIGQALGPIMLGGHLLSNMVDVQRDITFRRTKEVVTLARGARREAYAYQGAGYPLIGRRYDVTLRYERMKTHHDLVEEILESPGPHEVVLWQRIHGAFPGNGVRVEFNLPRVPLLVDKDTFTFPPLFAEAWKTALQVEAAVGLGDDADPFTVVEKTQVEYDAGDPAADEAWFVVEGSTFKVGTAPEAGETIYVRLVPILQMFEGIEVSKSYRAAMRMDPRDLVLLEQ